MDSTSLLVGLVAVVAVIAVVILVMREPPTFQSPPTPHPVPYPVPVPTYPRPDYPRPDYPRPFPKDRPCLKGMPAGMVPPYGCKVIDGCLAGCNTYDTNCSYSACGLTTPNKCC